jgi:DNA-binding transcriptional regulator YiaG
MSTRVREKQMARQLEVCTRTLREWRAQRKIPSFKVGRIVLYDPEAVLAALDRYKREAAV